jgi:hypothetical protein
MDDIRLKIRKSIDYGALDHKWLSRRHINSFKGEEARIIASIAQSAFEYYDRYRDTIDSDPSLRAITSMCSVKDHITDIDLQDDVVFHLSNVFNQIIESDRALYQCYDCGTNARAIFLKLVETHRGTSFIGHDEQQRMKKEYLVKRHGIKDEIKKSQSMLLSMNGNAVFIFSLSIDNFGHVWVIEKIGTRYHHYQTCLHSHLFLDFLEHKDYGRNLDQSLDLVEFFDDLETILTINQPWDDTDYRLFAKLFLFLPVRPVRKPNPGFSFTWLRY